MGERVGRPIEFTPAERQIALAKIETHALPEPMSGCWLWTGAINAQGYGMVSVAGRSLLAHRAAYAALRAPVPADRAACHRCDTPLCVNPDHIFLGTTKDNMADMASKGRSMLGGHLNVGEANHRARLTEADVVEMRRLHSGGIGYRRLAALFGVNRTHVRHTVKGDNWRNVPTL